MWEIIIGAANKIRKWALAKAEKRAKNAHSGKMPKSGDFLLNFSSARYYFLYSNCAPSAETHIRSRRARHVRVRNEMRIAILTPFRVYNTSPTAYRRCALRRYAQKLGCVGRRRPFSAPRLAVERRRRGGPPTEGRHLFPASHFRLRPGGYSRIRSPSVLGPGCFQARGDVPAAPRIKIPPGGSLPSGERKVKCRKWRQKRT